MRTRMTPERMCQLRRGITRADPSMVTGTTGMRALSASPKGPRLKGRTRASGERVPSGEHNQADVAADHPLRRPVQRRDGPRPVAAVDQDVPGHLDVPAHQGHPAKLFLGHEAQVDGQGDEEGRDVDGGLVVAGVEGRPATLQVLGSLDFHPRPGHEEQRWGPQAAGEPAGTAAVAGEQNRQPGEGQQHAGDHDDSNHGQEVSKHRASSARRVHLLHGGQHRGKPLSGLTLAPAGGPGVAGGGPGQRLLPGRRGGDVPEVGR